MNNSVAALLLVIAMPVLSMEQSEKERFKRKLASLHEEIENYRFPDTNVPEATKNLFVAIEKNNVNHAVTEIQLYGADVNGELNCKSPLIAAIDKRSTSMVQMLMNNGADPKKVSLGVTPIQYVKNLREMHEGNSYGLGSAELREIDFKLNRSNFTN